MYEEALKTGAVNATIAQNEERSQYEVGSSTSATLTESDYEDKHVLLSTSKRALTIKHWLISHPTLVVDIDKIIWIQPAPASVSRMSVKFWGVGLTGIGWARDFHRLIAAGRAWEHSFVVKYENPWCGVRAGFTIENPEKFIQALETMLPGVTTRPVDEDKRDHVGYSKLDEDTNKGNAA